MAFDPHYPHLISLMERRTRAHMRVSEVHTPSQSPDRRRLPEMWAYKRPRIKHFHGVLSRNQHPYLLESRYGKVRSKVSAPLGTPSQESWGGASVVSS